MDRARLPLRACSFLAVPVHGAAMGGGRPPNIVVSDRRPDQMLGASFPELNGAWPNAKDSRVLQEQGDG